MSSLQGFLGNPAAIQLSDDATMDNMLGQAGVKDPQDRRVLGRKIKEHSNMQLSFMLSKTAREVEMRKGLMSKAVQKKFNSGELVIRPVVMQLIAKVSETDTNKIVFVESGQAKAKGWRDIAADGLPSGYPFLVTQIQLKAGKQTTPTEKSDVNEMKAEYQLLPLTTIDDARISNALPKGKLFIKAGNQDQFTEGLPMNNFIDTPIHLRKGVYELETPVLFQDKVALEIYIETVGKIPQGTFIELTLIGGGGQPVNSANVKDE